MEKFPDYPPARPRRLRRLRLHASLAATAALLVLALCGVFRPAGVRRLGLPVAVAPWGDRTTTATAATAATGRLVPLEAHIMSKCPDAQECLWDLVLPTMQQVHDKVNFTLSFIGRPTGDDGIECMHGPAECMGNILELCAEVLYPDPKIYLGFTNCLFRDYPRIPARDLVEDCALEHAVDVAALDGCATRDGGAYAMGLLRASVQRSAAAGVTKSCTVRLDGAVYCIRDGGAWTDCPAGPGVHDLIVAVERLYRSV